MMAEAVSNQGCTNSENLLIVEHRIVPNSWDQPFANTNPNTNSKYWKEVWTLLPKKTFLPSVTLSSHPKRFVVPYETLSHDGFERLSTTYTHISFFHEF